jgi:hypothetical protein
MKRTTLMAAAVGLAAGLGIGQLAVQPAAVAQAPEKGPKWEYKVVVFSARDDVKEVKGMTADLNDLAADGWEYVGPVAGEFKTFGNGDQRATGFVAFRRPKK